MSSIDEFALIRLLNSGKQPDHFQRSHGVVTGIGDDAAVVNGSPGCQWILTCDTMTEEVHFKSVTMRDTDIGFKAMASAVSDIAAMGGVPRYALIALNMPKDASIDRIQAIYEGLYECANQYHVMVVGGDTTSCIGGITITVTVIGEVETGQALLRSSARVGDVVFITGDLGCSAAGLEMLLEQNRSSETSTDQSETEKVLIEAHRRPLPQVEAGQLLQRLGMCHALNDISDGLASEAWEIAEASGVGIDLVEDRIPVSNELFAYAQHRQKDPLDYILYGGEDYQLIGTASAEKAMELQMKCKEAGLPLYIIGYVNGEDRGVRLVQSSGFVLPVGKKGYNHFD